MSGASMQRSHYEALHFVRFILLYSLLYIFSILCARVYSPGLICGTLIARVVKARRTNRLTLYSVGSRSG